MGQLQLLNLIVLISIVYGSNVTHLTSDLMKRSIQFLSIEQRQNARLICRQYNKYWNESNQKISESVEYLRNITNSVVSYELINNQTIIKIQANSDNSQFNALCLIQFATLMQTTQFPLALFVKTNDLSDESLCNNTKLLIITSRFMM
eukprot:238262_1